MVRKIFSDSARTLKGAVRSSPALWGFVNSLRPGVTVSKAGFLLYAFAGARRDVFFIQIGANDAMQGDQLHEFVVSNGWRGIMVEPVKYVFDRLAGHYGGRADLILENAAVAAADGFQEFYHLAETDDDVPAWYDQIGSFSRETILKHAGDIPGLEQRIVAARVPCLTFQSLCDKHGVERIDLLYIDTEGYDFEIIKTVDFARRKPLFIVYEHKHLSDADRAACLGLLRAAGYETLEDGGDTLCLDAAAAADRRSKLAKAWRVLKKSA
jgi:FkbM family methyltransferase